LAFDGGAPSVGGIARAMTTRNHRLELSGIEITYDDVGERGGLPLVMIHGFTGHRDDFETVRERLGAGRRTLIPDLRGHGGASKTGSVADHSFEQLVVDLGDFLDALDVQQCHLLGHSMGGMVALRYVLAAPDRVSSLIMMNSSPDVPTGMSAELLARAGEIAMAEGMPALQQRVERRATEHPSGNPSDRHLERWADRYWAHQRKRYAEMDPAAYMGLGQAMSLQKSVGDRLAEVSCPTLVMVGADDEAFLEAADQLTAGFSDVVRVTIPNAGHHPHQENPEAWWQAMDEHFERVRA
jgi:pimeloyl-ACP methyl ester carboxylesterase